MSAPVCSIVPLIEYGKVVGECVSCPEVPEIIGRAGYTIVDPQYGWNSTAISTQARTGDSYTQFSLLPSVATAVGLVNARLGNDMALLSHAIMGYRNSGKAYYGAVERGAFKTAAVAHAPAYDVFRIERRGSVIRYFANNRQFYESTVPSLGPLIVVACMYAAGDGVN